MCEQQHRFIKNETFSNNAFDTERKKKFCGMMKDVRKIYIKRIINRRSKSFRLGEKKKVLDEKKASTAK